MKYILCLLFISTSANADCVTLERTALEFSNSYIQNIGDWEQNKQWIDKNSLLSNELKSRYKKLVDDALKKYPDYGLGFDPILDAQDFPDKGFVINKCDFEKKLVTLQGKGWASFKLQTYFTNKGDKYLINSIGYFNEKNSNRITSKAGISLQTEHEHARGWAIH